jgi:hypothetical protein
MLPGGKNETVKNGKMWKKRKTGTQAGNAGGVNVGITWKEQE